MLFLLCAGGGRVGEEANTAWMGLPTNLTARDLQKHCWPRVAVTWALVPNRAGG
jgi:hypothetical protein